MKNTIVYPEWTNVIAIGLVNIFIFSFKIKNFGFCGAYASQFIVPCENNA